MSDGAWYIGEGGERRGPYSRDDVDAFVTSGRVRRETLVWSEGMANWARADSVGLFAGARVATVPNAVGGATALPGVGVGTAMRRFFANYATFTGRASRAEFWWPTLVLIVVGSVAATADSSAVATGGAAFLSPLLFFATIVPSTALVARRLHDTDRTAWFLLLVFVPFGQLVLFVLCALQGTPGPNRFGTTA